MSSTCEVEPRRSNGRHQGVRLRALLLVALVFSACSEALPSPSPSPSASAPTGSRAVVSGQGPFTPPGCASVRGQAFTAASSTSEWRCQLGAAMNAQAFMNMLRTSANAQGWRECTPGMLFVRDDEVMTIALNLYPPPPQPPLSAPPTDRGQHEIAVTIALSKRAAPTCKGGLPQRGATRVAGGPRRAVATYSASGGSPTDARRSSTCSGSAIGSGSRPAGPAWSCVP